MNVHAVADTQGNVVEEDESAASDKALEQGALDEVRKHRYLPTTTFSSDMYVNVRFGPNF